ncbi:hypothetical protein VCRA2126O85_20036 [Vibrio crassostreae]|nr:hypothetical protein VCRA2127O91_20039 [Vibrio crassostreae]CAK2822962.1 hypothetical protein VCRA2126O86_20036 [Vibrio crassostreae]CAK2827407.1 hypothetical protein VCRA2126O85_20036 [Vibrio crassostreae]CAK2829117.1 hypothetical protein VCRA2125O83_20039 [Vibrio crassostreae]CAK2917495.1 hypothetical protein VCRA2128O106_30012 [Vibrio crassostreae]
MFFIFHSQQVLLLNTFSLKEYSPCLVEQQAFPCQVCDNCAPGLFKHYVRLPCC